MIASGLETACLRPALSWFIDPYGFMVTVLKSEGAVWAREDGVKLEAVTE